MEAAVSPASIAECDKRTEVIEGEGTVLLEESCQHTVKEIPGKKKSENHKTTQ